VRIAVLNDIHGNLPALDAVLREVAAAGVDQIVVGGDVLPGPMPSETLARLFTLGLPTHFLYGNGEIAVLERRAGRKPARVPEQYQSMIAWNAEQLSPEDEQALRGWPLTVRLSIPGLGETLFCHATPQNENDIFTRLTPEERLLPLFQDVGAALVVCGHSHMQFDRMVGSTRVVNAGSIGMPYGHPDADWLILGPGAEFRHTAYNFNEAIEQIRATGCPNAEDLFVESILHPPDQVVMTEAYERAALGRSSSPA